MITATDVLGVRCLCLGSAGTRPSSEGTPGAGSIAVDLSMPIHVYFAHRILAAGTTPAGTGGSA